MTETSRHGSTRSCRRLWHRRTTPTRAVAAAILAMGMTGASFVTSATVATAVSPPGPFNCNASTDFLAQGQPTQLWNATEPGAGVPSPGAWHTVGSAAVSYNAVGFDPAGGYLYAIAAASPTLLRIADNGSVTVVGAVTGLPAGTYAAGSFDGVGRFWVTNESDTTGIYRINVASSPPSATRMALTGSTFQAVDVTYAYGYLWGFNSATGKVARIDLTTGAVLNITSAVPVSSYTGAWTFANGDLGFQGTDAVVRRVHVANPTSATPTLSITNSGAGPSTITWSDGASCATHPTTTSVSCVPSTVPVGNPSLCTATVTDSDSASAPTGTVSFSSSGAGSFTATACVLSPNSSSSGQCAVSYTPTATGSPTITASYADDATHHNSTGTTTLSATTHATSTSVACVPSSVPVSNDTTCTATVDDVDPTAATTPGSTVTFTDDGSGSFTDDTCTLVGVDADSASCSVTYVPGAAGSIPITGTYAGDTTHSPSSGSTSLTVTLHSTTTTIACSPASVTVGNSTTCTVTVDDGDTVAPSAPTGTVTVGSDGAGDFTPSTGTCTLAQVGSTASAACTVDYVPSAVGDQTLTASYGGDTTIHDASQATTVLPVGAHQTTTSVSCTPDPVAVNNATSCTVTVDDQDQTATTPSGAVNLGSDGPGSFSASTCASLTPAAAGSATCTFTYTPSDVGDHTITASYGGDSTHSASSGTVVVTVVNRAPEVVGLNSVSISADAAVVDSYDSSAGAYAGPPDESQATLASNGTITLSGAHVYGTVTHGTVVLQKGAQVSGTGPDWGPVTPAAGDPGTCSPYSAKTGITGKFTYDATKGDLTVSGGNTATLADGYYCFHNVTVSGGSKLIVSGPVTISANGQFNGSGGSLLNYTMNPVNLQISTAYAGNNGVILSGGSYAYALIFAPNTSVTLSGGSPLFGAVLGKTLVMSGNSSVHCDTSDDTLAAWSGHFAP